MIILKIVVALLMLALRSIYCSPYANCRRHYYAISCPLEVP